MAYDFNKIAKRYDLMNHLMTLGMDRGWRRQVVKELRPHRHDEVLDVACGTGDMSVLLLHDGGCHVHACDISEEMLAIAKKKCGGSGVFVIGDAESLPYGDGTFDAVTCAFGVRNFVHLGQGLHEMVRVVKPGGRLAVLELATPDNTMIRPFYRLYTRLAIPLLGRTVAGNGDAYRYLIDTVEHFPKGAAFMGLLEAEGCRVVQRKLFFGVCRLYVACKG